jgi:allantoate deiminase
VTSAADVIRRCRTLADCSQETGFTTRPFLSPPMRLVHEHLTAWMKQVGMHVHLDNAGNIHGVYAGLSDGPRLFIGSHLDTVPRAGAFDGVLGVVLGIALVEMLNGERFPFSIEVIGFSDEEGVRFGVPFIGSRAFAGTVDTTLLATRDAAGLSIADAIRDYGLDPDALGGAAADAKAIGYVEFHIEQGPVLDSLGVPLGIVDSIVGQTRVDVTFAGAAGHAGTTPMRTRRDALAGAAEWIVAAEQEARSSPGLVATVGRIDARPGASNVIAGVCATTLDVRHADDGVRAAAVAGLAREARDIAARRGLEVSWTQRLDQAATSMDPSLVATLERAVRRAGVPVHHLSSGAGHDAMIVGARMPAAMLFLRSPGGISHHPDESVLEADVDAALEVGLQFLRSVAPRFSRPGDLP